MAAHTNLSPTRALPLLDQALVLFNCGASLSQSGCSAYCTIPAAHTLAPPPHDQRTSASQLPACLLRAFFTDRTPPAARLLSSLTFLTLLTQNPAFARCCQKALHNFPIRPLRSKKKNTRFQHKKDWIQQRVPSPASLIMQNRSRERGSHTSEYSECDSAPGEFSLTAPVDVALWTQSVSGTPYTGSDLFSFGQEDLSNMARNFLHFPKDDDASISSSMDDSAYMSQPDTGRRGKKNENYQVPQDARSQIMEPFVGSHIYSPTLSVESHGTFHGTQSEMGNMMLPPTAGSDNGESNFKMSDFTNFNNGQVTSPTDFTFRAPMQSQWGNESQSYSAPFVSGSIDAPSTFLQRQNSYPSRAVQQPYFAQYPSYGIDSMISNSQNMGEQRRVQSPFERLSATAAPADVQRPTLQQSDSKPRFEGSEVLSPASTVMTSQFPMFHGGSEYGEEQNFMPMTTSESMMESATVQPSAMKAHDEEDEHDQDAARKSSEEAEVKLARTHPLYQAQPQADEMYHCPFEGQANCQHKATKLKCNYDKYVDSHLKPFRCKNPSCLNVEFSSTACLLRHEREAHGMHGHGSKPHLCAYPDCERAIPGNGFPRRYNLYDHMKRVHDYTSPATQTEPSSPRSQSAKRPASRKRKSTGTTELADKRQRTAAQIKQANTARQRDQEKERLRQAWAERMAVLQQRLRNLNEPKDAEGHQQLIEDATALQKIVAQLTEMG